MSKELKVGDRVAAYTGSARHVGVVKGFCQEGGIVVYTREKQEIYVHPKQCRRLKKRERRRWTIRGHHLTSGAIISSTTPYQLITSGPELKNGETVEVIEVRRK